jgi:hypothetical protein
MIAGAFVGGFAGTLIGDRIRRHMDKNRGNFGGPQNDLPA